MVNISIWVAIIVPIVCVFLSYFLGVWKERRKDKASSNKALQKEMEDLKSRLVLYEAVEPSKTGDYYVRKIDGEAICPVCWRAKHEAIPIYGTGLGSYACSNCNHTGVFDRAKNARFYAEQKEQNSALDSWLNYRG